MITSERKKDLECSPDGIVIGSFGHSEFEVLVGHSGGDGDIWVWDKRRLS